MDIYLWREYKRIDVLDLKKQRIMSQIGMFVIFLQVIKVISIFIGFLEINLSKMRFWDILFVIYKIFLKMIVFVFKSIMNLILQYLEFRNNIVNCRLLIIKRRLIKIIKIYKNFKRNLYLV